MTIVFRCAGCYEMFKGTPDKFAPNGKRGPLCQSCDEEKPREKLEQTEPEEEGCGAEEREAPEGTERETPKPKKRKAKTRSSRGLSSFDL